MDSTAPTNASNPSEFARSLSAALEGLSPTLQELDSAQEAMARIQDKLLRETLSLIGPALDASPAIRNLTVMIHPKQQAGCLVSIRSYLQGSGNQLWSAGDLIRLIDERAGVIAVSRKIFLSPAIKDLQGHDERELRAAARWDLRMTELLERSSAAAWAGRSSMMASTIQIERESERGPSAVAIARQLGWNELASAWEREELGSAVSRGALRAPKAL